MLHRDLRMRRGEKALDEKCQISPLFHWERGRERGLIEVEVS